MPNKESSSSSPIGNGRYIVNGVADPSLRSIFSTWKRRVAGSYRAVLPYEIAVTLPNAAMWVTTKIDGELWFLVIGDGESYLANPRGDVITGDIPLFKHIKKDILSGRTIVAGELYAAKKGRRSRVGNLSVAMSGGDKADTALIQFAAFDLVEANEISALYDERLNAIQNIFGQSEQLSVVGLSMANTASEVSDMFAEVVELEGAEGLVVRDAIGLIYKIKPSISFDCVIVGYTVKANEHDMVRSILLGLTHENNLIQIVSACGSIGSAQDRKNLLQKLVPLKVDSKYRHASDSGGLYTFVKPEIVVEVRATDIQAEKSDGGRIESMILSFDNGWQAIRKGLSGSLLHPVMLRIREDKVPNSIDTRFNQLSERIPKVKADQGVDELPKSQMIRREAWTKDNKGKVAVRKLVIWKTNKEQIDNRYPGYVIHWTDYSPGRASPLDREVRIAIDEQSAVSIAEKMIEDNIKKGWEKYL